MYAENKGYPKPSYATGCLTQTVVLTVNKSKQLELLGSPAVTGCSSLDVAVPTGHCLPAPGSGIPFNCPCMLKEKILLYLNITVGVRL